MRSKLWLESPKGGYHSYGLDVDGMIKIRLRKTVLEGADCSHLAEGKVQWWAPVITAMNFHPSNGVVQIGPWPLPLRFLILFI
jgi:hypothetical protein